MKSEPCCHITKIRVRSYFRDDYRVQGAFYRYSTIACFVCNMSVALPVSWHSSGSILVGAAPKR